MKTVLLASSLFALASAASALEIRTPAARQVYTCESGLSRVATAGAAPCCEGRLRCAQFLSTTSVLRPRRDPRT